MSQTYKKLFYGTAIDVAKLCGVLDTLSIIPVIKDQAESARLAGFGTLFTDQEVLPEDSELSFLGYEMIDSKIGSIGKVLDVQELPQQLMLTVSFRGEEKYIPLVDDFIDYISQENQEIWLNLPDGLLHL